MVTDEQHRRMLVEWNATGRPFEGPACVHQLFEMQATRTPNAIAVEFEGRHLTYAELEAAERLTIGRPIANTTVSIADNQLEYVPLGEIGELPIGGDGLARGYHARPDLGRSSDA